MALRRPSFLPSLDELEQQAQDRSAQTAGKGSQFDHPTAKYLFWVMLVVTVVAHVVAGIVFLVMGH
ncbi:hypothetical protein GCM10009527_093460 [Actinomadura nitritigenes]|uniref:Uncharacterized protein n=1 Tax=Actinomadura nitritigenes TaxID=134602 RepID=A0ABS3QT61_9ACTN|nr:hypothetical protein [Actinomadura nitritigenes]MBO2437164.1 hypothetical protein [Actinomadura nitritigenes]